MAEKYLPLYWTEGLLNTYQGLKGEKPNMEELRSFVSLSYCPKEQSRIRMQIIEKYPLFFRALQKSPLGLKDSLDDLDSTSNVSLWSKSKQVFRFDKDFLSELVKTEDLKVTKDLFDRLPFTTFYLDCSENKALCSEIKGNGCFITIEKGNGHYYLHTCRVTEELFFNDVFTLKNEDGILPLEKNEDKVSVLRQGEGSECFVQSYERINRRDYQVFLIQALTYLSSYEPDIRENETTKRTYRKPDPDRIKNKYSEIQMQDVGVRFGTAFRTWTEIRKQNDTHVSTGVKQKPHYRRAHWHSYWFGKGKAEKKVVWLHECAINMDLGASDVVIHKAKKGQKNEKAVQVDRT